MDGALRGHAYAKAAVLEATSDEDLVIADANASRSTARHSI